MRDLVRGSSSSVKSSSASVPLNFVGHTTDRPVNVIAAVLYVCGDLVRESWAKTCAGSTSSGTTAHIVMPKPFSAMKHRAVLGYGAQVHVVENRNCAETKLRELVGDYQAVVVHPFNDPFVIAGQGAVMVSITLPISTSC